MKTTKDAVASGREESHQWVAECGKQVSHNGGVREIHHLPLTVHRVSQGSDRGKITRPIASDGDTEMGAARPRGLRRLERTPSLPRPPI